VLPETLAVDRRLAKTLIELAQMEHISGQAEEGGGEHGRPGANEKRRQKQEKKPGKKSAVYPIHDQSMKHSVLSFLFRIAGVWLSGGCAQSPVVALRGSF
jgi:hypothetical protein